MPLRRRLLALITVVLALCLVAGGALTYWHGVRKIETEMSSAIGVGESAVRDGIAALESSTDAVAHLQRIVSSFDGDRHLVARLTSPDGSTRAVSQVKPPSDPAPGWLYRLLTGPRHAMTFALSDNFSRLGKIVIEADPHNEVSEVWEDAKLKFVIVAGFCSLVLAMIYGTLGRALRPLEDLSLALARIGKGDYHAHVAEAGPEELKMIYKEFNRMADQLQSAEQQNQRLNEQLTTVQEEERTEIARDLHDEIGPFLFAVDVDAQTIQPLLERGKQTEAIARSQAIRQSVGHMQTHLRGVLARLRPAMLVDLGLAPAVEQLVAFWRARNPAIVFETDIVDERFPGSLEEVAFRILQEGTNNAIRHGKPSRIGLSAHRTGDGKLRITVTDDGSGLASTNGRGFGLIGMRERVYLRGGDLLIAGQSSESGKSGDSGVTLIATLPLTENANTTLCNQTESPRPV